VARQDLCQTKGGGVMPVLVDSFDDVSMNAIEFSKLTDNLASVAYKRFARFTHWYYFPEEGIFAPSKFIGYKDTTLQNYEGGDTGNGGLTENRLQAFFKELPKDKKHFIELYAKLVSYAKSINCKINSGVLEGRGGIHWPKEYNKSGNRRRDPPDNIVIKSGGTVEHEKGIITFCKTKQITNGKVKERDVWSLDGEDLGSLSDISVQLGLTIETHVLGLFLEKHDYVFDKPFGIIKKKTAQNKPLGSQPTEGKTEKELPIKDEEDYEVLKKALSITARRDHNKITNKIRAILKNYDLQEGSSENMFDILVKKYNSEDNDLLIEVKSSDEMPHVRMAVGQLYDYSRQLQKDSKVDLAVFLQSKPSKNVENFLKDRNIGLLWFEDNRITSNSDVLSDIFSRIQNH
jgi:hypothetical protein